MVFHPTDAESPHTEAIDRAAVRLWATGEPAQRLQAASDVLCAAGAVDEGAAWLLDHVTVPVTTAGPRAPAPGSALPGRLWHLPATLLQHPALASRDGSGPIARPTAFAADPQGRVHRVQVLGPDEPGEPGHTPRDVGPWTLFVYGTLRQGECRAGALQDPAPEHIEAASVPGQLWETPDDYPVWTPPPVAAAGTEGTQDAPHVQGELVTWSAPPPWARLDDIEEFHGFGIVSSLFLRTLVHATDAMGRTRHTWAYTAGPRVQRLRQIASGDWFCH